MLGHETKVYTVDLVLGYFESRSEPKEYVVVFAGNGNEYMFNSTTGLAYMLEDHEHKKIKDHYFPISFMDYKRLHDGTPHELMNKNNKADFPEAYYTSIVCGILLILALPMFFISLIAHSSGHEWGSTGTIASGIVLIFSMMVGALTES